ncbi:uncharacterized protein [Fopius arisanus]|uniref:Uncharacterized protein n=1 Tax=Fopius arisanus TaxID=64838 RepID=A0A9R1UAB1_9HYME|nr:PREDICTED: uncharacterized protein LOC105272759 [Fopius arisanus]
MKNSSSNLRRRRLMEGRELLQKKYNKALAKAKRDGPKRFSSEVENLSEASRLFKVLGGQGGANLGCLITPHGSYTWTPEESLRLLLEEHFPGARSTESAKQIAKETGSRYKPHDWALAAKIVHSQGLEWAIKSFELLKAPGPDGVYQVLPERGMEIILGSLTKFLRASVALKTVPRVWEKSKIVFLSKPGRYSYIKPRDSQPINLTSFDLKTMERLMDTYIKAHCS